MTFLNAGSRLAWIAFGCLMLFVSACQKEELEMPALPAAPPACISVGDRSSSSNLSDFIASSLDLSSFNAAIIKTGLEDLFSRPGLNATLLAPTDDGFALLPPPFNNAQNISQITDPKTIHQLRQIVRFHLIRGARTIDQLPNGPYPTYAPAATTGADQVYFGRTVTDRIFINGYSEILAVDIQTTNGTVHAVGSVLIPPSTDLGQIILYDTSFTALQAAVYKTGLWHTLFSSLSSYTLFAPSDAAFAALPAPMNNAANINAISDAATIDSLRNILLYHLVPGRLYSVDLRETVMPETILAGNQLVFFLAGGLQVKGNNNLVNAHIIRSDLQARNGVAHRIDQVLIP